MDHKSQDSKLKDNRSENIVSARALFVYARDVLGLFPAFREIKDSRKNPKYSSFHMLVTIFLAFMGQCSSLRDLLWHNDMLSVDVVKWLRNAVGDVPAVSTMWEFLARLDANELRRAPDTVVGNLVRTGVFDDEGNKVDGWRVVSFDGNESLKTNKKRPCKNCQKRVHSNGVLEYSHRWVACALVSAQSTITIPIGAYCLSWNDATSKQEGEHTGALKLMLELFGKFGRFADVIVVDALYVTAKFSLAALSLGIDVIVTLKKGTLKVYQAAVDAIRRGESIISFFETDKGEVVARDLRHIPMTGMPDGVRVIL